MTAQQPKAKDTDTLLLIDVERVKQIIAGVRTVRLEKNIPQKEPLELQIVGGDRDKYSSVISKMCNLSSFSSVSEKQAGAAGFMVGTTEYAIPLTGMMDVEAELQKLRAELTYTEGFLQSVVKKLSNERFVQNAKPEIVETERRKQADAESKIALLKENIAALSVE